MDLRAFFHVHRDPDWQADGPWCYYVCRCGARRIRARYSNLTGPARQGWNRLLIDRHGQHLNDSGWVKAA